ncbi:hypothetical protein [Salicibibacter kimchii]|uniref:Uncharacterized protein n=1 Tax=Salicibibacter kimchii TaxID=2099786 RepID=A0A345BVI9_9BACI|nr:hypothetical protein [Salicibibacter kimchii]AXF54970.1 hypothetical protein DT065_02360 [Salicibibacter kimchii]
MYAQLCFKERSHTYAQVARIQSSIQHMEKQLAQMPALENDEEGKVKAAMHEAQLHAHRALYHELESIHNG